MLKNTSGGILSGDFSPKTNRFVRKTHRKSIEINILQHPHFIDKK